MSGCEVEVNVGMPCEPTVLFRLVGIEIIQDDMNFFLGMAGNNVVHEVEELTAPTPRVVAGLNQSCRHFKGSKQGAGSMSHIFVTEPRDGLAVGQSQPTLCTFQRLNMGFLINRQNDCAPKWGQPCI